MFVRVITGPTGSGKSKLAEAVKGTRTLVNADAFQCYRELPILSNRESSDEEHFFGCRSLQDPALSAGAYAKLAEQYLNEQYLWVGCGLYLHSALYGLDSDRRKGTPFQKPPRVPCRIVVLSPAREELYHRLNERVDAMMKAGALDEAKRILDYSTNGRVSKDHPALKAIGLQHLLKYLSGEWSMEFAVQLWKRDTRRLAKRQWTWLKKFAAPSASVLWLEQPSDSKIKAFWDES